MPRRSSSSSMSCSSATTSRPDASRRRTARPSTCGTSLSPIVVFCSKGDNITPPQQALGWILDLYRDVDEIRAYGQTIVYTVHETVGHLGIFVSGGVARKEHSEFSSNIDLIDVLPPGLYEATFEAKSADTANPELAGGKWIMRCEQRTLDDLRAMGGNTAEDERRFATAARVSEINLANYRTFMQPWIRAMVTPQIAEWMRNLHPLRVSYEAFGGDNAAMKAVAEGGRQSSRAAQAGAEGQSVRQCFRKRSRRTSSMSSTSGAIPRKRSAKRCSSASMDRPWCRPPSASTPDADVSPKARKCRRAPRAPGGAHRRAEIADRQRRSQGMRHSRPALCRNGAGHGRRTQSRGIAAGSRADDKGSRLTLAQFKTIVREQFFMLLLEPEASLAAIPKLLPPGDRRAPCRP